MAMTTEEFAKAFHALDGTTIGERRKGLFGLLNRVGATESHTMDFNLICPKTALEEKFFLETLIRFRRIPELVAFLKSENPASIKRILNKRNSAWFLKGALHQLNANELIASVLRHVSLSTKVKILNRLSQSLQDNHGLAEDFFEAIEKTYGLHLASKLLPSCGPNFILGWVKTKRIVLTPKQLLTIIKRHFRLAESILEAVVDGKYCRYYSIVFAYLKRRDFLLFYSLHKKYRFNSPIGRRVTHRFVRGHRSMIMDSPKAYYDRLHQKRLVRSLGEDFLSFYIALLPESVEDYKYQEDYCLSVLRPLKNGVELFRLAFEQVYGVKPLEDPQHLSVYLFKFLKPTDVKPELKALVLNEDLSNCYQKTAESVPYFKKRISLTSDIRNRASLIGMLVYTCRINSDTVALEDVFKYVLLKHRNDHVTVREAFFRALTKHFDVKSFEETLWSYMHELMRIFEVNEEPFYERNKFLALYIHSRLDRNLPVKEELIEFARLRQWNLFRSIPRWEKVCLMTFSEIVRESYGDDDPVQLSFIYALHNWNRRHLKDQMDLFGSWDVVGILERVIASNKFVSNSNSVFGACMRSKTITIDQKANLLKVVLGAENLRLDRTDVFVWLLKREPSVIQLNLKSVMEFVLLNEPVFKSGRYAEFWRLCSEYSHLRISEVAAQVCSDVLKTESEGLGRVTNHLIALIHLGGPSAYLDFSSRHSPKSLQADYSTKEALLVYAIQSSIGASVRHLVPPSRALPVLLSFAKGDYLKLVRSALYSLCDRVNEDRLDAFVGKLSGRAVSVRKHALHLTFRGLDKSRMNEVLLQFMRTERNASVKKFIFKVSFDFFIRSQNDSSWQMVRDTFGGADKDDQEALDILLNVHAIPPAYYVRYMLLAWEILEKGPDSDQEFQAKKGALLETIGSDQMRLLPPEFCRGIIDKYVFEIGNEDYSTYFLAHVQTFACKFVMASESEEEGRARLKRVFEKLGRRVRASEDPMAKQRTLARVRSFPADLCGYFLKDEPAFKGIFTELDEQWNGLFDCNEALDQYVHLKLTSIFLQTSDLSQMAGLIGQLYDSLADIYGLLIVDLYLSKVKTFFYRLFNERESKIEEMYTLIEGVFEIGSLPCAFLTIHLLLYKPQRNSAEIVEKYNAIMARLAQRTEPIIKLYLNLKLYQ